MTTLKLFDLIQLHKANLDPTGVKLHMAVWNGHDDPLDVYLSGKFDQWQRSQTAKNFQRTYVVSLIQMPESNRWLFGGLHRSGTPKKIQNQGNWIYPLAEDATCKSLNGRLIIRFKKDFRASYLKAETWADQLIVDALLAEAYSIADFPGFKSVDLTFDELELVVRQGNPSWRSALSSVSGVYLITDHETGKLYVGSATGEGGLWSRWAAYANNGHGGNTELRRSLKDLGLARARRFRFSVLEIADIHESEKSVLNRESHWKRVLMTRIPHGLNAN